MSISTLALAYRTILRNPQYRGWVILGSFLYLISPIDLSPDLIPLLGQIDDVALIALLFSELSKLLTETIDDRFRWGWWAGLRPQATETMGSEVQETAAANTNTPTIDVQATPVDRST